VVPALLLLIARDLLLHDPPRILAWRLLHDPRLQQAPAWLLALLPRASPGFDRDPIALLLAGLASGLGLLYLALGLFGARARWRGLAIAAGAAALIVAPAVAFTAMGLAADRPYGQDGGVVQLPIALDKILAGQSPYGADYSDSVLGQQARSSAFWEPFGGNPILHHHAYLPGTHAIFLPFYLVSKAAFGVFDPRFVTLIAYFLAAMLAALLFESGPRRLLAAGIVALNPLVYWHQIFGANDLLFVALLLAAWLAAERGRPRLAGLLLGLACATKQLAWPFAPFLLLHLSGVRQWSEILARDTWRRLSGPLAVAALTFVVVVAPVAALDPKAFYADIVVYNVGLPGADNYPLGGTPGFGFANFLIYFGRVSSLREYFPFGIFYVLLLPLGILLVRAQFRDGGLPRAFLNGSLALLASLYFSRVVHPNYLIPLAVILPLAVLSRGRGVDGAVVPLLLLAAGVEAVENGVFRLTWDQAVAAAWPKTLTGLAAALVPRSAPGLTADPIGLVFSALAAGLALAYLVTSALGGPRRLRLGLAALAALLVVAAPTVFVVRISERTGTRGQDPWTVQAQADADRLGSGISPFAEPFAERPSGREAWSSSFRLEPARLLVPDRPAVPPGAATLLASLRRLGFRDPRWITLFALAVAGALVLRSPSIEGRPLALGMLALLPVAFGTAFGSPEVCAALLLCATGLATAQGRTVLAGIMLGLSTAVSGVVWPAMPFFLLQRVGEEAAASTRRRQIAFVATFAALCLPAVFLDPRSFAEALARARAVTPGLGIVNVLLYLGIENESVSRMFFAAVPLIVLGVVASLWRLARHAPDISAAFAALLCIFLSPSVSPEAIALPILLTALLIPQEGATS